MIVVRLLVVQRLRIVTVDTLESAGGRSTKDGMNTAIRCACRINPAVFYVAATRVSNTSRGERARHTEVIDITTEVTEQ